MDTRMVTHITLIFFLVIPETLRLCMVSFRETMVSRFDILYVLVVNLSVAYEPDCRALLHCNRASFRGD